MVKGTSAQWMEPAALPLLDGHSNHHESLKQCQNTNLCPWRISKFGNDLVEVKLIVKQCDCCHCFWLICMLCGAQCLQFLVSSSLYFSHLHLNAEKKCVTTTAESEHVILLLCYIQKLYQEVYLLLIAERCMCQFYFLLHAAAAWLHMSATLDITLLFSSFHSSTVAISLPP